MFDHRAHKHCLEYVAQRVPSRDTVRRSLRARRPSSHLPWSSCPSSTSDVRWRPSNSVVWCRFAVPFLLERIVKSVQCGLCCRDTPPRTHHARLMVESIHVAARHQRDDTVHLDADGLLFVAEKISRKETYRTERTVVVAHEVPRNI